MDAAIIVPIGVVLVAMILIVAAWWIGQNRRARH
jgi:hypothetical protein